MISMCYRTRRHVFALRNIYYNRRYLNSQNSALDEPNHIDSDLKKNSHPEFSIDARSKLPQVTNAVKVKITQKEIEDKIVYNSLVDSFVDRTRFLNRVKKCQVLDSREKQQQKNELLDKEVDSIIASLIMKKSSDAISGETEETKVEEDLDHEVGNSFSFPYLAHTPVTQKLAKFKAKRKSQLEELHLSDELNYGTPNPDIPVSIIPCGGCGAKLHCQSPSIPGYLPSEIFTGFQTHDLRGQICQRCRFLRDHDVALNVNISPEEYPKVISVIRDQVAMVILVVDLLDFPCSIWPGLLDIIGTKRPVCVVGNKVDLIPKDSKGYLNHIQKCLVNELENSGISRANIKLVSLISATTGFGVEQLITKIQNSWGARGDVYLLGCTNVGKSSLFNALISSDFCKTQASDLLERATVSAWPGTTLNL